MLNRTFQEMFNPELPHENRESSVDLFCDLLYYAVDVEHEQGPEVVDSFPPGLKDILLINDLDGEVRNGGFAQYFSNRAVVSPDRPPLEVAGALRRCDAAPAALLVERAWNEYLVFLANCPDPDDREVRAEQYQTLSDRCEPLDKAWGGDGDGWEEMANSIICCVRERPGDFEFIENS